MQRFMTSIISTISYFFRLTKHYFDRNTSMVTKLQNNHCSLSQIAVIKAWIELSDKMCILFIPLGPKIWHYFNPKWFLISKDHRCIFNYIILSVTIFLKKEQQFLLFLIFFVYKTSIPLLIIYNHSNLAFFIWWSGLPCIVYKSWPFNPE